MAPLANPYLPLPDSEQAARLTTLAEQALDSHGLVYVHFDEEKNCTFWAIVKEIEDGKAGRKVRRHYEIEAIETAKGHEAYLAEFEQDVITVVRDRMMFFDRAQSLHHGGKIYGPESAFKIGKHSWLWYMPLIAAILFLLEDNYCMALIFFCLFLSSDGSETGRREVKDAPQTEDSAPVSLQKEC